MRVLSRHGVGLGPYSTWQGPDNPEGFWEDRRLVRANDILLEEAGASWARPQIVDRDLAVEGFDANQLIEKEMGQIPGFKDPRSAWTWPTWRRAWPTSCLIGVLRHPADVVNSLLTRNDISSEEALHLWEGSYKNLAHWGARWIHFPSRKGLRNVLEKLGLSFQPSIFEHTFKSDLVHFQEREEKSPFYDELYALIEE